MSDKLNSSTSIPTEPARPSRWFESEPDMDAGDLLRALHDAARPVIVAALEGAPADPLSLVLCPAPQLAAVLATRAPDGAIGYRACTATGELAIATGELLTQGLNRLEPAAAARVARLLEAGAARVALKVDLHDETVAGVLQVLETGATVWLFKLRFEHTEH